MDNRDSMAIFKACIFHALPHPTRISIVESLGQDEMTVSSLCETVGIAHLNASIPFRESIQLT